MAKSQAKGRSRASLGLQRERRLTATQVTGFIILPLLCMVVMVVTLLAMKG
jgi:hypothetical protein